MSMIEYEMIPLISAEDFPDKVQKYCWNNEISIDYQNDIAFIEDDGNAFAEWLKEVGVPKTEQKIIGTFDTLSEDHPKYGQPIYDPWYDWAVAISAT